jgi:hypothetical protein
LILEPISLEAAVLRVFLTGADVAMFSFSTTSTTGTVAGALTAFGAGDLPRLLLAEVGFSFATGSGISSGLAASAAAAPRLIAELR